MKKEMLHIWLDESDKKGEFYSNFYGGICIRSSQLNDVLQIINRKISELNLTPHEIKWQNVNQYFLPSYIEIVDMIFDLLEKDLIKMRIFFHHNQYSPTGLTEEQKSNTYQILYYQFIKNAFGLRYSEGIERVQLRLDQMPISNEKKQEFKSFLLRLNKEFRDVGITLHESDIYEVNSKNELPLQIMDLILGSMCFKLNNKHRIKPQGSRVRGNRTIAKDKLYKHINSRIRELRPGFNVGVSTGYRELRDIWTMPYRHWSFRPAEHIRDFSKTKAQKNNPPTPT